MKKDEAARLRQLWQQRLKQQFGIKQTPWCHQRVTARPEARKQKSLLVLEQLRQWLDQALPQVPPKSLTEKARHDLNNQWDRLVRYCDKGYLRMDNNLAENAIRPFEIGRKAWLFSASQKGANQ